MMHVAIFKGTDKTLLTGAEYMFTLAEKASNTISIVVHGRSDNMLVEYESISAFLRNWDSIESLERLNKD